MRRERLIWFAIGAATSAVVTIVAMTLRTEPEPPNWGLIVDEGTHSQLDGQEAAIWRGAEIARDCGAKTFEMIPARGVDVSDVTIIPLVLENNRALVCIHEQVRDAGLWFGITMDFE